VAAGIEKAWALVVMTATNLYQPHYSSTGFHWFN